MLSIRHMVLAGQVWLTAAMTLVAGLPHWQCLCPDGSTKPVCLKAVSSPDSCCCNGTCCRARSAKKCCSTDQAKVSAEAETRSCCGHSAVAPSTKSDGRHIVPTGGCSRSLAATDQVAMSPTKRASVDVSPVLPAAAWSDSTLGLTPVAHSPTFWQTHLAPPPTDRVVTFLRLVI